MGYFNLSANINNGFADGDHYIVTPNAKRAASNIANDFHAGIHSFTIIGTYGTGKSSFLLALESDLQKAKKKPYLLNSKALVSSELEIINIVGDYSDFSSTVLKALNIDGCKKSVVDELDAYYRKCQRSETQKGVGCCN